MDVWRLYSFFQILSIKVVYFCEWLLVVNYSPFIYYKHLLRTV